jgi:hypothetical protein
MTCRSLQASLALTLIVAGVGACNLCGKRSKCGDPDDRGGLEATVEPGPLALPRTGDPPSPELAVVRTNEGGIVAIDGTGQRVRTLVPEAGVSWCRIDPRADVLWYRHGEAGTLSLLDLESDSTPIEVLDQAPETVVIVYPDEALGRPEAHHFQDGIAVRMEEPPRVEPILGCDGDMAFYCFGDEIEDFDAAYAERMGELRKDLASHPLLADRALKALARRSRAYSRPSDATPGPALEQVRTVPREPCEEAPEDCGKPERLPGTPYWLVVVANSRGDFFYESRQLYDPEAAVFFDPKDPETRSPRPIAGVGEPFVPTWVSPSGKLGLGDDMLVELDGGVLATGFSGVCGFWGGGWEVSSR